MREPQPAAPGFKFYDGYNITAVSSVTDCHPYNFWELYHEWGPINGNKVSDKRWERGKVYVKKQLLPFFVV